MTGLPPLPVATTWFRRAEVAPGIARIEEPHVHEFLRANIWHVRGRDRDLIVDAGLGVASLHEHLPELFAHDPILVLTHAHLDHVGSAHEFSDRRMHPLSSIDAHTAASLRGPELAELLGFDAPGMPDLLIGSVPTGFDPADYAIHPAPATSPLEDGEVIELGDRRVTVLHMPGHTAGSICLLDEASGALFSGDVIYDDILLDELHESDIEEYVTSMLRLGALAVETVYPGHGDPFDGRRMLEIIADYVSARAS